MIKLVGLLGGVAIITLATCFIFMLLILAAALALGYPYIDSLIIGAALMFSSTIVSLKVEALKAAQEYPPKSP